jgi:hypothetical protein
MLERSVALDPTYAPAWSQLSGRYYIDGSYSDGGPRALEKSQAAAERALALDPDLPDVHRRLIVLLIEGGDLNGAYGRTVDLLRRRPDSGDAHFSMAYLLRYAGLLEESCRECDIARRLDPGDPAVWRSCAYSFLQLGRYDRAIDYARADGGSVWSRNALVAIFLRQGRTAEARELAHGLGADYLSQAGLACLEGRPRAEIQALGAAETAGLIAVRDSEPKYAASREFARCGFPDTALRLLRRAVEQNYCAWPAMDRDPLFASIRGTPEFAQIRTMGIACQKSFLEHRAGSKH